jgi:hypothetical protein
LEKRHILAVRIIGKKPIVRIAEVLEYVLTVNEDLIALIAKDLKFAFTNVLKIRAKTVTEVAYVNTKFRRLTVRNAEVLLTANTGDKDKSAKTVEDLRFASINTFVIRARNAMVLRFVLIRSSKPIVNVVVEAPIVVTASQRNFVMPVMELVCVSIVVSKSTVNFVKVLRFVLTTRFDINAENAKVNDFANTAKTKLIANLVEVFSFAKVRVVRLRNLRSLMDIVFNVI